MIHIVRVYIKIFFGYGENKVLFSYVFADIIYFLKLILVGDVFLRFRRRGGDASKRILMVVFFVVFAVSVSTFYLRNRFIVMLISIVSTTILCCVLYSEKILTSIAANIWVIYANVLIESITMILINTLMNLFCIENVIIQKIHFAAAAMTNNSATPSFVLFK
mgnify:CR=1 FL=1